MTTVNQVNLPTPSGPAYGESLRVGLIALSTDIAIERDFHRMASDDDVSVFTTRMKLREPNSEETFLELEHDLPNISGLILATSRVDVMVFGCTAASMLIGTEGIAAAVQRGRPGMPVTNPAIASVSAFHAAQIRTVAMLTPYTSSVTSAAVEFLQSNGLQVNCASCLGIDLDDTHARISEDVLYDNAMKLDWQSADAIFLSCTATRALNVIERIENATGKLVVTSNQAALWHALRLGQSKKRIRGYGRLFEIDAA